jgi:integrase
MACVRKWRGSWCVDYRDSDGKRHIEKVNSQDAGNEKLVEIAKSLRNKTFDPGKAKTLLNAYAVEWLESRRVEITAATFRSYEYALRVHILPALRKYELGKLNRSQVRSFLGKLALQKKQHGDKTLSRDTVRIIKAALHAMLETAVEDGILPVNVSHMKTKRNAAAARKRKGEKQAMIRRKVFSREQLMIFLKATYEHAPPYFALFFLLARAGLRIGEALALKIGDLDFVERLINVERTLLKDGDTGPPKSGVTRQVDMSSQLAKVLGQTVLDRKEELLHAGLSMDDLPDLWVFRNQAGQPMDYSKVRKVFARMLTRAELAQRNPHYLRHTFASLLLQQGESLKYVSEQLGHSSIQITADVYGHLVPGGNRQAVDRLDDGNILWKHSDLKEQIGGVLETKMLEKVEEKIGATRRSRTGDLLITNQLLCRLS